MSELISGKDAWIAKSENRDVDWKLHGLGWQELTDAEFMSWDTSRFLGQTKYQFRLKPRTITINEIEVPAPFEPKEGEIYYYISFEFECGYSVYNMLGCHFGGAWRNECEIKQVVAALHKVFKGE